MTFLEPYKTIEKRLSEIYNTKTEKVFLITKRPLNGPLKTNFTQIFWLYGPNGVRQMKQGSIQPRFYEPFNLRKGEYPVGLTCVDFQNCSGKAVIITNDKRILKDHEWLDNEKIRTNSYSARYVSVDKNNPYRFDVSLYPRVIKPLDSKKIPRCKICELTLKNAMTVAVADRVLERTKAPVTIDTELAELRNCPYLSRVAFDVDRIKDICKIRNVQLRYPHWNGKAREFRKLLQRMEEGALAYEIPRTRPCSKRLLSKSLEMKAHEFAAPLVPVRKEESLNERGQDDDKTIIIDNDIPFSQIASSMRFQPQSRLPFPQLALEIRKDQTRIQTVTDSETESEEFVSETEIRNRTQNWINNQDPTLVPRKTQGSSRNPERALDRNRCRRDLSSSENEEHSDFSLGSSNMVAPLSDEDSDYVPERFERAITPTQTNSTPKDPLHNYFRDRSTPIRSKKILATTSSGRMPKIQGLNWENQRFKTTVNDQRAAFNDCFSGRQDDLKTEIKKKAANWLKSVYWARRSCYDIIKALEDMKKTLENFEDDSGFGKLSETPEFGEQQGETTNLETMFAELSNLLES